MKNLMILTFFCLSVFNLYAQDQDLLKSVDSAVHEKEYVTNAFKSSRVINGHSIEMLGKGVLDFRILHRFGPVNDGIKQFFGLDQASMRLGFDYGITDNFTVGIGRSTLKKELDGFVKFRVLRQAIGQGASPVTVVLVGGVSANTLENTDPANKMTFSSRLANYYQAVIGRKFSSRFSFQVSPTVVHRNSVQANDDNDVYAVGFGGRYKFSKHMAFVMDYFYVVNGLPQSVNSNPLSAGIDIETGGHVFQLHFSNASGMNERAFITETLSNWGKGDIRFGFNLSRVFTLGKNKTSLKSNH